VAAKTTLALAWLIALETPHLFLRCLHAVIIPGTFLNLLFLFCCWLLAVGCWLLVVGCCVVVVGGGGVVVVVVPGRRGLRIAAIAETGT